MFKYRKDNTPDGPVMATIIDDSGDFVPIIPGMALFVITKPGDNNSILPFIVHSVGTNKITLALKLLDGSVVLYPFECKKKIEFKNAASARQRAFKKDKSAS